jgi:FtsZ-interacting cell division protein ZipA
MDSNELSLIAVIISLISVVIALWIAWTNHRALNFTRFDRETELRRQHAKACSELMEEIQATEKEFASELRELEYLEPEFEILLAKSKRPFYDVLTPCQPS